MTAFFVVACIILFLIIAVQVGKITEVYARIKGEKVAQTSSNNFNGIFGIVFLVAFLLLSIGSAWYYKNYMLGYGPLHHASKHGKSIQTLFNTTLFFTGIVFVLTQIALFWYAYKYRDTNTKRKVLYIPHDNRLEVIWTVIPSIVMCGLVVGGLWVWNDVMADVKEGEDYLEIEATGYQFAWAVRYPGADNAIGTKYFRNIVPGVNDLGVDFNDPKSQDDILMLAGEELVLPKGKKVRVRITSKDVIHNFYLPHFSVKMDAIPGLPTFFVFTPTMTTEEYRQELKKYPEYNVPEDPTDPNSPKKWESFNFELACSKLCGVGHFSMRRQIRVVEQDEYNKWAAGLKPYFIENIKGKIEPGKYSWYKGDTTAIPKEFNSQALETAKEGDVLELNHINFATGSANLTPESATELSLIIDALNKYPTLNVEVSGHTDNVGEAAKNKTLSEARAKAVEDFVEKHGIDTKRISSVGFGDSKPIADSGTDAGRQLNRRTEFKILSK